MLEPLITWAAYRLVNFLINILWAISLALWYIEKAVAWLGDQIVTNNIWETIIEGLLTGMAASMPATLQTIMFGAGGGLFYLALIVVGILLLIPFISRVQPVLEVQRVFGWTLVVTFLFISSTSGYDIINVVEQGRMGMMSNIASGYGSNQVSQLVAGPMSATAAEINVNEFQLPAAYEDIYYPDPTAFETVEVVFYDAPLILGTSSATLTVETNDSLNNRISQASLGIVLVILNLIPMGMVAILVASFVGLTATSLVILLFFIMALPLGMFESGMLVITQIIRRYLLIWILSIFMAVFPGTLLGVAELTLVPPVTLESLFLYIGVLLVAVYATYHVARWVFNIATESFSVIGQSLNAVAFGSVAASTGGMGSAGMPLPGQATGMPIPHQLPPSAAMGTVAAAMVAPSLIQTGVLGARALPYALGIPAATMNPSQKGFGQVPRENQPLVHVHGEPIPVKGNGPANEPLETYEEGEWRETPMLPSAVPMLERPKGNLLNAGEQREVRSLTAGSDDAAGSYEEMEEREDDHK